MPASRITETISSGVTSARRFSVGCRSGETVSSMSFSITMWSTTAPVGRVFFTISFTVPDTLEWTGQPSIPSATSPIFCPRVTVSPTLTQATAGAPMCWDRGIVTFAGGGRASMRHFLVFLYSST